MRAMILAAGLGTRMRPLTEVIPKPMLPVANRPLLRYHLEHLKTVGVREVMINLHHLPEVVPREFGRGTELDLELSYALEEEILGTGGGVKAVEAFLTNTGEPFLLMNGDLLIDVSLPDVLHTHRRWSAWATMVLREDPDAARYGALGVDGEDRIIDFVGRARAPGTVARQGLFTGIHVLEPEVLEMLPPGNSCINLTAYPRMVAEGRRVQAHFQKGFWSDVGTPERYWQANMAVLEERCRHPGPSPFAEAAWSLRNPGSSGDISAVSIASDAVLQPPLILGAGARIGAGARVGPSVCIGGGAVVGGRASVVRSVLWAGVTITEGDQVSNAVVWKKEGETRILDGFRQG